MKSEKIIIILLLLNLKGYCQLSKPNLSFRISLQSDFQKEQFRDTQFPFEYKELSATQINWGFDVLTEKEIAKSWYAYIGVGYFQNKFNFKRFYDHRLLNPGIDSTAISTSTTNYIFNLIRLPIGISYQLIKKEKFSFNLGIENIINFSFNEIYNGTEPFPGANKKLTKFEYYGNSVLLVGRITKDLSKSKHLQLATYIRVLNTYKAQNPVLYENSSETFVRIFDAIGISISYNIEF